MSYNFINLNKNDSFAFLRGIDLQELLVETENYFLEYRNKLNLPDDVTIGVEIEYEGILKKDYMDDFIEKKILDDWNSKKDGSLNSGGEITSPVMTDNFEYWRELKLICDYLSKKNVDTKKNAGGHIHIGARVLGKDIEAWRHFLKLYIAYESVLFRFIYGDKISARKKILKYAPPIASKLYKNLNKINDATTLADIRQLTATGKYSAVNFSNTRFYDINNDKATKNTIEFRSPNATTSAIIWQNNINTFAKMLVSSKDKVMDEEFLNYKLKHEFSSYSENEYLYNNINLKNVLEFVDLVFDNNLDKVYFLRQYLKDFQENYGTKTAIKAKRFVKR